MNKKQAHDLKTFIIKNFKIHPHNFTYYIQAFTHRSYSNENKDFTDYERLEFLGDSVISLAVADYLYSMNNDGAFLKEGEMSKMRSEMTNYRTLISTAVHLNLHNYILLGNSLKDSKNEKVLEDIYEALVGAIYKDQGEAVAKKFIQNTLITHFNEQFLNKIYDYKTLIQELLQSAGSKKLIYKQEKKTKNNQNEELFNISLMYDNICYGKGQGLKLKEAEQNAAKIAYKKLILADSFKSYIKK